MWTKVVCLAAACQRATVPACRYREPPAPFHRETLLLDAAKGNSGGLTRRTPP
jgi:hypothetical protein